MVSDGKVVTYKVKAVNAKAEYMYKGGAKYFRIVAYFRNGQELLHPCLSSVKKNMKKKGTETYMKYGDELKLAENKSGKLRKG